MWRSFRANLAACLQKFHAGHGSVAWRAVAHKSPLGVGFLGGFGVVGPVDRANSGRPGYWFATNVKCSAHADLAEITDGPIDRGGVPNSNYRHIFPLGDTGDVHIFANKFG
jgi:hypothetical protein